MSHADLEILETLLIQYTYRHATASSGRAVQTIQKHVRNLKKRGE